jgi:hypothetical protein
MNDTQRLEKVVLWDSVKKRWVVRDWEGPLYYRETFREALDLCIPADYPTEWKKEARRKEPQVPSFAPGV